MPKQSKFFHLTNELLKNFKSSRRYCLYIIDLIRWRIFRLVDYKAVEICADLQDNLMIIPGGGTVESIREIAYPFNDELLAETLIKALAQSKYQDENDPLQENILEKRLGVTNYEMAVRGRRLIFFCWSRREGYGMIPTGGLQGSNYYELSRIPIGKKIDKAVLVKVMRQALELSITPVDS